MPTNKIIEKIDHSLLKPTLTREQVREGVEYALKAGVASICVMPCYLNEAKKLHDMFAAGLVVGVDTVVYNVNVPRLSTVIGFPHGNVSLSDKIHEIKRTAKLDVVEFDAVINYSHVLSGRWRAVANEIKAMHEQCREYGGILKVIFETCYLDERQKINLCELCSEIMNIGYVKTSTGFATGVKNYGATVEDIQLMKKHTGSHLGVKASGGIRTLDSALEMIKAGADRIGVSATKELIDELKARESENPPF